MKFSSIRYNNLCSRGNDSFQTANSRGSVTPATRTAEVGLAAAAQLRRRSRGDLPATGHTDETSRSRKRPHGFRRIDGRGGFRSVFPLAVQRPALAPLLSGERQRPH